MKLALLAATDGTTPIRRRWQQHCPPLGLLCIREYIRRYLPAVEVVVGYDADDSLLRTCDLIGLSAVTENFPRAVALARRIRKQTPAPLLLGGAHITLVPCLPDAFDVGVMGEGEETVVELLRVFLRRGGLAPEDLLGVRGILFRHPRRGLVRSSPRPLIRPLDRIPFPRRPGRDVMDMTHIVTSRGCPYRCSFCSSPALWRACRMNSAKRVVAELQWIQEHVNPHHVKIFDDLFVADRNRLAQIADGITRRGISFAGGLSCFVRSDFVDDPLVETLARVGVTSVGVGFESASGRVLRAVGKRTTPRTNQRAVDALRRRGIGIAGSFLIGVPGETAADLDATIRFIERNRQTFDEIEVCPVVPFPGTALWQQALARGLVSDAMDWSVLRDGSHFADFDLGSYLYLNPSMPLSVFAGFCAQFAALYRDVSAVRCEFAGGTQRADL